MKKQNVSLKKLNLSKSNIATLSSNTIVGGTLFDMTDNGCGPEKSVWPDICPVSHNCPTANCPTYECQSFACNSAFCESVACESAFCISIAVC